MRAPVTQPVQIPARQTGRNGCVDDDSNGQHRSRNPSHVGNESQDYLNQPHHQTHSEAYANIYWPGRKVWAGILSDQVEYLTKFETVCKCSFARIENHYGRINKRESQHINEENAQQAKKDRAPNTGNYIRYFLSVAVAR